MKSLVLLLSLFLFSCAPAEKSPTQIRHLYGESVARMELPAGGSGSGFVVQGASGKLFVATNAHVCEKVGAPIRVNFTLSKKKRMEIAVGISLREDLCLVSLKDQTLSPLEVVAEAKEGEHIFTVGHPLGKALTAFEGSVVGIETGLVGYPPFMCSPEQTQMSLFGEMCAKSMRFLSLSAWSYPGNSGGPLLNDSGQVVGIVFASGEMGGSALSTKPLLRMLRKR